MKKHTGEGSGHARDREPQKRSGFTLIELLVVIAFAAILAGIFSANYFGARSRRVFEGQIDKIVADLQSTRERSRSQENGNQWGIHFENPAGEGNDFYEVWQGTSYASGTIALRRNLDGGVEFTTPVSSSTLDVVFAKATGLPTATTTIVIHSLATDDTGTITVSSQGTVDFSIAGEGASVSAPSVTTNAATGVGTSTATLNGSADPNGAATDGWFRYSTINPGNCNNIFGTMTATNSLGAGTDPVAYLENLTGLPTSTTYYYCALASNSGGTATGSVDSFTTTSTPPSDPIAHDAFSTSTFTTGSPHTFSHTPSGTPRGALVMIAQMNNGDFVSGVTYGGQTMTRVESAEQASGEGGRSYVYFLGSSIPTGAQTVSITHNGDSTRKDVTVATLTAGADTQIAATGTAVLDSTQQDPSITLDTGTATSLRYAAAYSGRNSDPDEPCPGGGSGFAINPPAGCSTMTYLWGDVFGTVKLSHFARQTDASTGSYTMAWETDNDEAAVSAVAVEEVGQSPPTVVTNAASDVGTSTATLNGSANPNGDAATGWFRYATSTPGDCNDSFGTRVPPSGGDSLGAGTSSVAYSENVTGLSESTTYYYCALASNAAGTATGSIVSFTTTSTPSTITGSLISSTLDTGFVNGVKINSVLWQGTLGTGGTNTVKFQIASANCPDGSTDPPTCSTGAGWGGSKTSGDGAFIGSDGTSSTFYEPSAPGAGYSIVGQHTGKRYFRYKVQLEKDDVSTSPTVTDIIVNWTP